MERDRNTQGIDVREYGNLMGCALYGSPRDDFEKVRHFCFKTTEFSPIEETGSHVSMNAFRHNPLMSLSFRRSRVDGNVSMIIYGLTGKASERSFGKDETTFGVGALSSMVIRKSMEVPKHLSMSLESEFQEAEIPAYRYCMVTALAAKRDIRDYFGFFHYAYFLEKSMGLSYESARDKAAERFNIAIEN